MSFTRGVNTLSISAKLYVENRSRLLNALKGKTPPGSVIFLEGGVEKYRYNTDASDQPFRQESYFFWAFGVHESGVSGAIDIDSGKSILFPPRLDPDYAIWHGRINRESWFQQKYSVDEVFFVDHDTISKALKENNAKRILLLKAFNSDSGDTSQSPIADELNEFDIDVDTLYPIIAELRVLKTDQEIEVMKYVCKVSSEGHKNIMQNVKPGMYEYQLESLFGHYCYFHGGCRHLAYIGIVSSGANSAVLHYGHAGAPNDKQIADGDMCLIDIGAEYNCYASDITTTFPANGKFTENQRVIYNAVLKARNEVIKAAKPGVHWADLHLMAERAILCHLERAGIVRGDLTEMLDARVGAIFMPHGLGHLIGLDVHDCGGYLGDARPRSTLRGLKYLRLNRPLKERMAVTIEPGCYFIDTLLDAAIADHNLSKFIVQDRLAEFRGFGGIRIEDNVIIRNDGCELLTHIPRTVEEIENFMKCV